LCCGMDKGCWVDTGFPHESVLLKKLEPIRSLILRIL
jgi:hypothetical protein